MYTFCASVEDLVEIDAFDTTRLLTEEVEQGSALALFNCGVGKLEILRPGW